MVDGRGYDLKRGCPWVWKAKIEIEMNAADVSDHCLDRQLSLSVMSRIASYF
jgi:hypothetical protein